jgi:hypothetical protein
VALVTRKHLFFYLESMFFHSKLYFLALINSPHFFDHSDHKKKPFFLDLKSGKITRRTEASQSAEEKKPTRIPRVAASETGKAHV